MTITDTHAHIYSEEFQNDTTEMMQRAFHSGVTRIFVPSIDSTYTQKMYELQAQFPDNVFLMIGLHPCYVKENYLTELEHVEKELSKNKFYGIGEIGIDLYWDKSTLAIQIKAFRHQLQLAKKYKLPINIHCRDAFDAVFEVLEEEKSADLVGIFHCFTGNYEQALKAISLNMKLGIGGVVTFKNGKIDQFLNKIDIKNIVLETDAPYLAPKPFRGKRNESSYIVQVVNKLSEIYGLSPEAIAKITTENSKAIFGI
jgi:TatD DNase family protein